MATRYNHIQLGVVNANGDVDVLYPQTTARDVSIDRVNNKIPTNVDDLDKLVSSFGQMAFEDKDGLVFLGESEDYDGNVMESEINDDYVGEGFTWSSKKIVDSSNIYISSDKLKLTELTTLFFSPHTFGVDGRLAIFSNVCPRVGWKWLVEYFPVIIENNVVVDAYQRWTGISAGAGNNVEYIRVCNDGNWSAFIEK